MHLALGKEEICKFRRLHFLKYLAYPKEAAVLYKKSISCLLSVGFYLLSVAKSELSQ